MSTLGDFANNRPSHTPTPWEAHYTIIIGPDSEVIADTSCKGARQAPRNTQKANAQMIVRAVNAHTELVAALKNLVERIEKANNWDQRNDGLTDTRALLARINTGG